MEISIFLMFCNDKYKKDYPTVKMWISEGLSNIKDIQVKRIAEKYWSEKTADID